MGKSILLIAIISSAINLFGQVSIDENSYITPAQLQDLQRKKTFAFADFLIATTTGNIPFTGAAVSSGTVAANQTNQNSNRPGVIRLTSSTTANSGYRWTTDAAPILINGNEVFECAIAPVAFTGTTFRAGFLDNTTSSDAVDGIYFEYKESTAIVLKTSSNSTRTTSSAITTLSLNTWYKLRIVVNSNASSVTGYVYDANGVLISSQTNTTNIPTGAGRWTGAGFIVTNSGTTATALCDLDFISFTSINNR